MRLCAFLIRVKRISQTKEKSNLFPIIRPAVLRTASFLVLLAGTALPGHAQVSLQLSSGTAAAGSTVTQDLTLAAAGTLPSALQWTFVYSPSDFTAVNVTAGPSASSSSKTLNCYASGGTQTCVLTGLNQTTIQPGVVARATLTPVFNANQTLSLQVTNSYAASSSAALISSSSTGGVVTLAGPPPDTSAPSVPGNLTGSAAGSSQINLTWSASSDNVAVTGYLVERCAGGGCSAFTQIASLGSSTTSYQDAGLAAGSSYSYRVRAKDAAGNLSGFSTVLTLSTVAVVYGPVSALGFHEGGGTTTADESGNGNNGTLQLAAWTSSGKFGRAISFNGVNSYVDLGNPMALQITGSMALSAWVFPTLHPSGDAQIVAKSTSSSGWQLKTTSDTGVRTFGVSISSGSTRVQRYSTTVVATGTWYHVAGVYNATARTLDIYVNGVLDNGVLSGTVPGSQTNAGVAASIGRRSTASYFSGLIDEVRLYAQAQTPAQVQADMATAIGGVPETGTVSPSGGQGTSQSFTITATHGGGANQLTEIMVLIGGVLNGPGSCWIVIQPQTLSASLINDLGTGPVPGTVSAGIGSAANSQCTLSGVGFGITKVGNTVTAVLPITFSNWFLGTKNIFERATDSRGETADWTGIGTWSMGGAGTPQTGTMNPSGGTGSSQTFTITAHHSGGADKLTSLLLVIHENLYGPGACYLSIDPQNSSANLVNDAATGFSSGLVTPGSGSASNSQCTLSGAGFSIAKLGTTLTVTLPLTFNSSFTGQKYFYEYVSDNSGQNANWATLGAWTTSGGGVPQTGALTPSGGAGGVQTFTVTASHSGGADQLTTMMVMFSATLNGPNSCWILVSPQFGSANLVNDEASGYAEGTVGAGLGSTANSQCVLSGVGFSVTRNGNNVTVTLPLRFSNAFEGSKTVYEYLVDGVGQKVNWTPIGTWVATRSTVP